MSLDPAKPDETRAVDAPRTQTSPAASSSAHAETAAFDSSAFASRAEGTPTPGSAGCGSAAENPALPEVFGRYRVVRLLGRGGMGSVYLAHDQQLDRPVALKVPRLAGDPSGKLKTRFLREARAVAVLNHPNICPVFDAGQVDGVHFLAMAYIQGHPLSQYLETGKPQPERGVALSVYKIALALEEAHAKGILHRDLKPANVMVDSRGEPIVMDFGLSQRVNSDAESRLTQEGTVLGTPAYMAPEQIDGRSPIGPTTDVYSLGVVLYELLTGRCPFEGSVVSVIGQILHSPTPAIAKFRPDITPALATICEKAIAKEPAKRFSSMKDFAAALAGFLKGKTATTVIVPSAKTVAQSPAPLTNLNSLESLLTASELAAPALTLQTKGGSRSGPASVPLVWIVVPAAALMAIVVLLVFVFWPSGEEPQSMAVAPQTTGLGPTPPILAPSPASAPATNALPFVPESAETKEPAAPPILKVSPDRAPGETAIPGERTDESTVTTEPAPAQEPLSPEPLVPEENSVEPSDPVATPPREPKPDKPRNPQDGGSKNLPQPRQNNPSEMDFPPGDGPPPPPQDLGGGSIEEKFAAADRNHDGKLDPGEVPFHIINRTDKNADHAVDLRELQRAFGKLKEKLFERPSAAELRRLPRQRPGGPGQGGPGPGGRGPGGPR